MRNRVPLPDLDRGKKETVGQKTWGCGGDLIVLAPRNCLSFTFLIK